MDAAPDPMPRRIGIAKALCKPKPMRYGFVEVPSQTAIRRMPYDTAHG
jgi:hypothetical protein